MSSLQIENLSGSAEQLEGLLQKRALKSERESTESASASTTFSEMLRESVDTVNQYQKDADHSIRELVSGRTKNIHETMLTVERADLSMKLMMQVRNKIMDAYREIMRMQI